MTNAKQQPARGSARIRKDTVYETIEFAHKRDKRRRKNQLAKAARRKQRK